MSAAKKFNKEVEAIERFYRIEAHDQLPVFKSDQYEDHVSAWIQISQDIDSRQWYLGAIADSVDRTYKEAGVMKFAGEVMCSARTIYEYAKTYRIFQKCERSQLLSFSHHLAAAYDDEPRRALVEAEDEGLSVRALRERIQERRLKSKSIEKLIFIVTGNLTEDGDVVLDTEARGAHTLSALLIDLAQMRQRVTVKIEV